jgi:hypothetical protein
MNESESFLIASLIERIFIVNINNDLNEISFIKNKIDERVLHVFINIIKDYDSLTHLSLVDNKITNYSSLFEELSDSNNIKSLNLNNNKMANNTFISFSKNIRKLKNLESLFLVNCDLSNSQKDIIFNNFLHECPNIKEIYFSNNVNEMSNLYETSGKTYKQVSLINTSSETSIKERPSKRINFALDVKDGYENLKDNLKSNLPRSKSNSSNFADSEMIDNDDEDYDCKNDELIKKTESLMLNRKHPVEHWISVGNFEDRISEAHVKNYLKVILSNDTFIFI